MSENNRRYLKQIAELRKLFGNPEQPVSPEQEKEVLAYIAREFAAEMDSKEYGHQALRELFSAEVANDSAVKDRHLRAANVFALLSHRDAIEESTATLKEIARQEIKATTDLNQRIKEVGNVLVPLGREVVAGLERQAA